MSPARPSRLPLPSPDRDRSLLAGRFLRSRRDRHPSRRGGRWLIPRPRANRAPAQRSGRKRQGFRRASAIVPLPQSTCVLAIVSDSMPSERPPQGKHTVTYYVFLCNTSNKLLVQRHSRLMLKARGARGVDLNPAFECFEVLAFLLPEGTFNSLISVSF